MDETRCNFCGSEEWEERRIKYLYSYKGNHLLVPDMPVEVCLNCGMIYYPAAALKEVERHFFAIYSGAAEPERYIKVPETTYAAIAS